LNEFKSCSDDFQGTVIQEFIEFHDHQFHFDMTQNNLICYKCGISLDKTSIVKAIFFNITK